MSMSITKFLYSLFFVPLVWGASGNVFACEDIPWKRGRPYDYYASETRVPNGTFSQGLLAMVNQAHFPMKVQLLQEGNTGQQPGDLLFVLASIPNHPGALDAYSRYEIMYNSLISFKNDRMNKKPIYKAECFFHRALTIYPQYSETYKAWGIHLYRNGEFPEAIKAFNQAQSKGDTNADIHYNLGLTYLAMKDYENSVSQAKMAYAADYPLQGLKNKLGDRLQ